MDASQSILSAMLGDPAFLAAALLAGFFVGLSKGGLPIIAILAVPLMALFVPPLTAAAVLLPVYVVTDMVGLWIYRRRYSTRNLAILTPAAIAGCMLAWATVAIIDEHVITLIVGVVGLFFCLNAWTRHRRSAPAKPGGIGQGLFWGGISGFVSFVSHAGGPPYQIYMLPQRLDKLVYAGTTTILFAIVNLVKVGSYWQLGELSGANLASTPLILPIAIAGTFLGSRLLTLMREDIFYRLVEIALFVVSLKLIQDAIW